MLNINPEILAFWKNQPDTNKATQRDIEQFEIYLGRNLPESYKKYLKEVGYKRTEFYNEKYDMGSAIAAIDVRYDVSGQIIEKQTTFGCFYSLDETLSSTKSYANPMELYEDIGPRIPPDMIIAGQMGNGYALLDLSQKNYGRIWFWDRVDETWGTEENNTIGYVGSDVFDVLSRLYPVEI